MEECQAQRILSCLRTHRDKKSESSYDTIGYTSQPTIQGFGERPGTPSTPVNC